MAKSVKIKVEGDELVVRFPIDKNLPESSSGKMKMMYSSHGFITTDAEYKGQPIRMGVNIGISNKD